MIVALQGCRFVAIYWLVMFALFQLPLIAQSTSPYHHTPVEPREAHSKAFNEDLIITFSEFSVGTSISTQYQDLGIHFGGDSPFISRDGSNPTSPVLSGTPRFQGAIEGTFVDPDSGDPVIARGFSMDAGFFDEIGSVRLQWFDLDGNRLGQRASTINGIENFQVEGGGIASWRIEIIENEPAGFAIDNVSFDLDVASSILFREKIDSEKEGTWGFAGDGVPGFDHVSFHIGNDVYESHPGYWTGTYTDAAGDEMIFISHTNGVQQVHSRKTFEHDARVGQASPVVDFDEIPITSQLAESMKTAIEQQINQGAKFQGLDFDSIAGIRETLLPAAQKGGDGTFTCVGLVEWAAEQAGHNGGNGFIKDCFESFSIAESEWPLLSPQLLNYAMKFSALVDSAEQWLQGLLDPVDFLIIDPLGRRLGHTASLGTINEIPNAFYSGDGNLEQFLIPNPVPGDYQLRLFGLGEQVDAAINSNSRMQSVSEVIMPGQEMQVDMMLDPVSGSPGDLDGDADIDNDDRDLLSQRLNTFTNNINDPGDLDGDGLISVADIMLLEALCTRPGCATGGGADCVQGNTNLCLNQTRFKVEVEWRDFQGNRGAGQVVPFGSDDSGLFWFFAADNWEMLVKVLNGCSINDRFWVFSAATTNVEYTLTVTDTSTGATKSYFNPLGNAAAAITDIEAFSTCSAGNLPSSISTVRNRPAAPIVITPDETPKLSALRASPVEKSNVRKEAASLLIPKDHECVVNTMSCNTTVSGDLGSHDCPFDDGTYFDIWQFQGANDMDVTINMSSSEIDTFLFLFDPDIELVAFDDDGGAGTNSRISFTLTSSGTWTIAANHYAQGDFGPYSLSLSCSGGGTPPTAPSSLTAQALGTDEIQIEWQDNSNNESEFRVEVRTTGSFQDIGSVPANSIGAVVGGLQPGTTYSFRVRARNSFGDSGYSNTATATTLSNIEDCEPSATNLCLNQERFKIEVEWRDFTGNRGTGQVVPGGSDDSGILWFFNADNWEMLIKVLDGCLINDRYWVFAAATTNVEYTLRVTDTETGSVRQYSNPLGIAADAITDTNAFATCP